MGRAILDRIAVAMASASLSGDSWEAGLLGEGLDAAVLGVAVRREDDIAVAYSWLALRKLLAGRLGGEMALQEANSLRHGDPVPLMAHTAGSSQLLQEVVRSQRLPYWSGMDEALLGWGTLGHHPCGLLYNLRGLGELVSLTQRDSIKIMEGEHELDPGIPDLGEDILKFWRQCMLPADLGPLTPWFLVPLETGAEKGKDGEDGRNGRDDGDGRLL